MMMRLYAVLDRKARNFGPPLMFANEDVARRGATQLLRDNNSEISQFPVDFDLYEIGQYSSESGQIEAIVLPKLIFCFSDLVEVK